jgi:hypothetical protein
MRKIFLLKVEYIRVTDVLRAFALLLVAKIVESKHPIYFNNIMLCSVIKFTSRNMIFLE